MNKTMKELYILLKSGLVDSLNINTIFNFKKDFQGKVKSIAIIISIILGLYFMYFYYNEMGKMLKASGMIIGLQLMLYVNIFIITMIALFLSIYKASSFLFTFKDFELLSSFPVRTSSIMASKIMMLYISNFLMCAIFGLPSFFVYGKYTNASILYYIFAFLVFCVIPIIPMIIGSMLSLLISNVSARFKGSNMIMIILSVLLTLGMIVANSYFGQLITNNSITKFEQIIDAFNLYIPFWIYGNAFIYTDFISVILSIMINVFVMSIFVYFFAKSFKTINAKLNENASRSNYKMKELQVTSPIKALYKKELSLYFSSYIYVLNTFMGMVMLTFYVVAIAIFNYDKIMKALEFPVLDSYKLIMLTIVSVACIVISCTSGVSISFEGKYLQLLKSFPVKFKEIALAKILVNLTVTVPIFLFNAVIMGVIMKFTMLEFLAYILIGISFALLSAFMGIVVNLFLPKFDWKSQVQVVKQSASMIVTLLINTLLTAGGMYLLFKVKVDYLIYAMLGEAMAACIITYGFWYFITHTGEKMFTKL